MVLSPPKCPHGSAISVTFPGPHGSPPGPHGPAIPVTGPRMSQAGVGCWGQSPERWQDTTEHLVAVTPTLFIAWGGNTPRDQD